MTEKQRGKLIVLEGMDGVGKTSIAKALVDLLRQQGNDKVIYVPNPGGAEDDAFGQALRGLLKSNMERTKDVDSVLFYANYLHLGHKIKALLDDGVTVVMDRWETSAHVYQTGGQEGLLKDRLYYMVHPLHAGIHQLPKPDVMIWVYADQSTVLGRVGSRQDNQDDRYETTTESKADWYARLHTAYFNIMAFSVWSVGYQDRIQNDDDVELLFGESDIPRLFKGQPNPMSGHIPWAYFMSLDTSQATPDKITAYAQSIVDALQPERIHQAIAFDIVIPEETRKEVENFQAAVASGQAITEAITMEQQQHEIQSDAGATP